MAKKAKKAKPRKKTVKKDIILWKWIVIVIPLIVGLMWLVTIMLSYHDIPVIYEQASPTGIMSLLGLIFIFIISYGAFVFIEFKRNISEL